MSDTDQTNLLGRRPRDRSSADSKHHKNVALAAASPDRWKTAESGTARYTGRGRGSRGGQNVATVDDADLATAIKELVGARAMLGEAYRMQPGATRREAIAVAIGKVALAGRYVDDLVIRRGGNTPDSGGQP